MAEIQVDTSGERAAAQSQVFYHTTAYVMSLALKCAVELNIFETIMSGGGGDGAAPGGRWAMTHSELLSKLTPDVISPTKAKFLGRVLRLVAQMGYLKIEEGSDDEGVNNNITIDGDGADPDQITYSLTPLSKMLLKANLGYFLLGGTEPYIIRSIQYPSEWFRSEGQECPLQSMTGGKSLWELMSEDPEFNFLFNEAGACNTQLLMKEVVERCKDAFKGLRSLVDLGGGTGAAAYAIAEAFPNIKCTVYDLPHVIAAVPPETSALVHAVAGDMFEHVPPADAIFLKTILHGWDDADCVKILKKCKEAIPANGGKVIVVEMMPADRNGSVDDVSLTTQLCWDVSMIAYGDGKERTEREWKKLFKEAGFSDYRFAPIGLRTLIEIFPDQNTGVKVAQSEYHN